MLFDPLGDDAPHNDTQLNDARREAPATHRNRDAILAVMREHLPTAGTILEIAAGTGQHAAYFARNMPDVRWLPTDADAESLPSIDSWAGCEKAENVGSARQLDVTATPWSLGEKAPAIVDAIVCINMIHIAPWQACEGLMRGAGELLRPGGVLFMYGPYNVDGHYTSASNERFEGWLQSLDPRFRIRDIADVTLEADKNGLLRTAFVPMPANNFCAVFVREIAT